MDYTIVMAAAGSYIFSAMQCECVKRERRRARCIRFLKEKGARNLYLYEGLVSKNTRHTNLLFARKGETVGVAHTKSGVHLHLFLSDGCAASCAREIGDILRDRLPMFESCFGDRAGVERFLDGGGRAVEKTRPFVFMELEKARYDKNRHDSDRQDPRAAHPAVAGEPRMAEALLSLQMQYEIEELGVSKEAVDRERTLASLRARIARREVTLVFDGERLVACAGVNARFETTCQIGSVYVPPAFRGMGYGYAVVSSHLARMFERYDRVVLFAGEGNAAARGLYGKLGFREAGALLFARLGDRRYAAHGVGPEPGPGPLTP
jgi:ribosomal protein S18 acetylase RimI-like enzyme